MELEKHKKSPKINKDFQAFLVGVAGFEPAASSSQTRRDNRATLHPDGVLRVQRYTYFNKYKLF